MLLQGSTGARIRVQTESGDIGNYLKYQFDNRWSIENPSDEHPRLASRGDTYYTGGAYGDNTYFLFSKDYLRLKNIEIGYTIKGGIKDKIGLKGLRVYANGLNVFTVDKNNIFDPEPENSAGTSYPLSRVINFGFNVSF
jgi:TonB-dependent starch-binding outer membrane protein SusC